MLQIILLSSVPLFFLFFYFFFKRKKKRKKIAKSTFFYFFPQERECLMCLSQTKLSQMSANETFDIKVLQDKIFQKMTHFIPPKTQVEKI